MLSTSCTLSGSATGHSSEKRSAAKRKKKDKVAEKVSKEKKEMTTFAGAMPNCGIWIEDEHVWDPDEVDEGDLAGAD